MALLTYSNIGIAGIAACVPKQTIDNYTRKEMPIYA